MISVLTVTADEDFAAACEDALADHDEIRTVTAVSVGGAVDVLESDTQVDCIVSDHNLPDTDGIAFLEAVRAQAPTLPFILFTSEGSETVASRAISAGATDYLIKEHHENQWDRLTTLVTDAVSYSRNQRDIVNTEARAKALLNAANDIIGIVRDREIAYLNDTGKGYIYGDDRSRLSADAISDVLEVGDDDTCITKLLASVQSGSKTLDHRDGELIAANGSRIPVEITATRVTWTEEPAVVLVVRDVSERERREQELRLKNRVIDEASVGITIADANRPDTPIVYANDEFYNLTGYREDEVLGRNCRFLQGENSDPDPIAEMREAIDTDESATVELRNYRKDGTQFWNRVTVAPIANDSGEVTHYVGFQEDVTDRVNDQQKLRRFQQAVEAAGHAIFITDPDGTITYVNPAFERITGYDPEEAIGLTPRILNSGEMPDEYFDELWATISDGDIWEVEIRDRRKSGELYYADQTIAPLTDQNGDVESYVAVQQDITDRKEREFQLQQYEQAIEGAEEMIAAIDDEQHYLFANEAYREFHGLDTDSLTGMTLTGGIGSDTYETVEPYLKRAFNGETVQYRMTRARPERSDRTFDIRYYPLEDDAGHVEGIVATMRDLTEQLEREQHIASLDRMLRHNLRNELNVLLGHTELLQANGSSEVGELSAKIEETAERILTQADKEREIVELLSDRSDPTRLDLADVVDSAVERVRTDHPGAEVTVEVPEKIQLLAISKLERAIEELVENGVVHTDAEPAQVKITATQSESTVELRVDDNGPGIPIEERSVISGDQDVDELTHSSGMGLWLVKRIVSRIDGDIRFEDTAQHGSAITLLIPHYDPATTEH